MDLFSRWAVALSGRRPFGYEARISEFEQGCPALPDRNHRTIANELEGCRLMSVISDRPWVAYAIVFAGVCGHASSEYFSVLSGVSGPETSVWRYILGSVGLLLLSILLPNRRRIWTVITMDGRRLFWLSLLGVTVAYIAFHWALDFASIVQVGTVVTCTPILVGAVNWLVNGEALGRAKIVTGFGAILGVTFLVTDGYVADRTGDHRSLIGIGMAAVCAATASIYIVLVRPMIVRHGGLPVTTVSMCFGAAGLWLVVGSVWGIWVDPLTLFDRPPAEVHALLTLGLWNTTLTNWLWFTGLALVPDVTRGSYLFFLKPVLTAMMAVFLLNQGLSTGQVAAITVICGAVVLEANWRRLFAA